MSAKLPKFVSGFESASGVLLIDAAGNVWKVSQEPYGVNLCLPFRLEIPDHAAALAQESHK